MTIERQALEFWQNAKDHQWHVMKERKPAWSEFYHRIYEKAVRILGHPPTRVIDYGVGGGWMAEQVMQPGMTYYGVDIAQTILDQTAKDLAGRAGEFVPILVPYDEPEQLTLLVEPSELWFCLTVYQHLPSKAYADRISALAYKLLEPGGVAVIQVRLGDRGRVRSDDRYKAHWTAFLLYDKTEFKHSLQRFGFVISDILLNPLTGASGYMYTFVRKP